MKLVIGTKNQAKINQFKSALKSFDLEIQGLPSNINFPKIEENYKTALENARKKSLIYAKLVGRPVISMDNALYFEDLPEEQQPGTNVRHFNNRADRPTDLELIDYYKKIIISLGNKINGYWEYGICAATPAGELKETVFRTPRIFVSKPSQKIIDGYPLESLQIDSKTGKYSSEMTQVEKDNFYQRQGTTGQKLRDFITSLPDYFLS